MSLDAGAIDQPPALSGAAASAGMALGPVFAYFPTRIEPRGEAIPAERRGLEKMAFTDAVRRLREKIENALDDAGMPASDRGIVAALGDVAGDEALREDTFRGLDAGLDAVSAVIAAASRLARDPHVPWPA